MCVGPEPECQQLSAARKLVVRVDLPHPCSQYPCSAPVQIYDVRLSDAVPSPHPPLGLPDTPSVAVFPFPSMSGDPDELLPILGPGCWLFSSPVNCSPSLDQAAGIFPACFDQGGPSAPDRLISSIGALLPIELCGRSSL